MGKEKIRNWFSNMLKMDKPLIFDGVIYHTVENFYQAMKIDQKFKDQRKVIANLSPHESKQRIRNRMEFDLRDNFNEISFDVMEYALRRKFAHGTSWHEKLMATNQDEIVENNNWGDQFWGFDIEAKKGENHLGKMLMLIRSEFQNTKLVNYKKNNDVGVSIMRGSEWGNPYYFDFTSDPSAKRVEDRDEAVDKFEEHFLKQIKTNKGFREKTLSLKNKTLRCCCKPQRCHGDVILKWLFLQNSYKNSL